jgi:hypothetical protein
MTMDVVEETRLRFRPDRIATLFVGESAPAGGDFFYYGKSAMTRYMREVIENAFGETDDFLSTFKRYGWYLDDLSLVPVDKMSKPERLRVCAEAQVGLTERIAAYQPQAIVSVLLSVKDNVEAAAIAAGCTAARYAVPFPGMGQQGRFKREMEAIIPRLPRLQH